MELRSACVDGRRGAVEQLLAAGADVNAANARDGSTALMFASQNGHSGIVPLLLMSMLRQPTMAPQR